MIKNTHIIKLLNIVVLLVGGIIVSTTWLASPSRIIVLTAPGVKI